MRVAAGLDGQAERFAIVVLAQPDAQRLDQFEKRMREVDQFCEGLLKQFASRRMSAYRPHQKHSAICKESSADYLISGK